MPIKGLFSRDENNEDEINKLIKTVKSLALKTNSLEVRMRQFAKLESQRQAESHFAKQPKKQSQGPRKSDKKDHVKQESPASIQKRLYSQVSEYISQALNPIHKEIDLLADKISVMETNFSTMKQLLAENMQQTAILKTDIEAMKAGTESETRTRTEKPIVIRELKVDKIMLDKYEQNNNIGCLGIKDLGGELNIGATYGKGAIPAGIADELIGDLESMESEAEQEMEEAQDFNQEKANDSDDDPREEATGQRYGGGHGTYFADQRQDDDKKDGFTDIPID